MFFFQALLYKCKLVKFSIETVMEKIKFIVKELIAF